MGNWTGEPTSYAYAWQIDGAAAGTGTADYAVQAGDVGKSATCVVTATNAAGSTAAPPSVGVVVA
jgi:predicted fused transcriptional regulator/phosphomethylpyrimidine kinase